MVNTNGIQVYGQTKRFDKSRNTNQATDRLPKKRTFVANFEEGGEISVGEKVIAIKQADF